MMMSRKGFSIDSGQGLANCIYTGNGGNEGKEDRLAHASFASLVWRGLYSLEDLAQLKPSRCETSYS